MPTRSRRPTPYLAAQGLSMYWFRSFNRMSPEERAHAATQLARPGRAEETDLAHQAYGLLVVMKGAGDRMTRAESRLLVERAAPLGLNTSATSKDALMLQFAGLTMSPFLDFLITKTKGLSDPRVRRYLEVLRYEVPDRAYSRQAMRGFVKEVEKLRRAGGDSLRTVHLEGGN